MPHSGSWQLIRLLPHSRLVLYNEFRKNIFIYIYISHTSVQSSRFLWSNSHRPFKWEFIDASSTFSHVPLRHSLLRIPSNRNVFLCFPKILMFYSHQSTTTASFLHSLSRYISREMCRIRFVSVHYFSFYWFWYSKIFVHF